MKKVIITGATGALGRSVTRHFYQNGYDVFGTSFKTSDPSSISLDVTSSTEVFSIIERLKPDYITHLSAVFDSAYNQAYEVNVLGAKNIFDSIKLLNHRCRVVLIGSAAEYGAVHPNDSPIDVNHVLRPVSIYGLTKSWQTALGILESMNGLDVVIARIFNLFGPGISSKLLAGSVAKQIECYKNHLQNKINTGNLGSIRDYIHTDDAARQLLAIMVHGVVGQIYHVASGKPIRVRDFVEAELKRHGLDPTIIVEDQSSKNVHGIDVPVIFADVSKTLAIMS